MGTFPSYSLTKSLGDEHFVFSPLEKSYQNYSAASAHRHDYYELILFNGNGGTHEIDFKILPVKKNNLHIVLPGQVHMLRRDRRVTGVVLSFTDDFFIAYSGRKAGAVFPFLEYIYDSPALAFTKEKAEKISALTQEIGKVFNSKDGERMHMIYHLLSLLLIDLAQRAVVTLNPGSKSSASAVFLKLVDQHFLERLTVGKYASMLNITAGHLNDVVQKDHGKSAGDIIHARLLLEAKRLLYHSEKSVKEIAADLNFEDPSYFSRFFRKNTELSPEEFRNHAREKHR